MDDGNRDHRSGVDSGRRGRWAWQARLFPELTGRAEARPLPISPDRRRYNPFARVRPAVEWAEAISSAESRRAYRKAGGAAPPRRRGRAGCDAANQLRLWPA